MLLKRTMEVIFSQEPQSATWVSHTQKTEEVMARSNTFTTETTRFISQSSYTLL